MPDQPHKVPRLQPWPKRHKLRSRNILQCAESFPTEPLNARPIPIRIRYQVVRGVNIIGYESRATHLQYVQHSLKTCII